MKSLELAIVLLISIIVAGCAASSMEDVKESGFLGDYSMLQPGGEDRAALVYIKSGVDFKQYNKIMFDRVLVSLTDEASSQEVDPAKLKELVDYYQAALLKAVKDGYEIVDQPGPGVLRVRTVITDVEPSSPTANTLSTILPVGWIVSGATKAASDENMGTGEAATEMEILDALTGERLAAAVDRRQGGKMAFRGKWEDTKNAFDFWAKLFRQRLDEARSK